MPATEDPYQFSMDDSISHTPRTRSSSRTRKPTNGNGQKAAAKPAAQRIATRSSQKSPMTPSIDEGDNSIMSNMQSGFSQFVNPKKRQRDEKKNKTQKRAKVAEENNENQPPDDEIQAIEKVKLIYETAGGRTNLARAAAANAQILANRTYTVSDRPQRIEDTQLDTMAIPDTVVGMDTQHNDSSWQRDIDRLMKKLEEPSTSFKSPTQIDETQQDEEDDDEDENTTGSFFPSQTGKTLPPPNQTAPKVITQPSPAPTKPTTVVQCNEAAIQTEHSQSSSSSVHPCCQDVSTCPCVLRYSKLERLFMEKMSRFISIVPNAEMQPPKRRIAPHSSRFRRVRGRRRIVQRVAAPLPPANNESTTVEEISDEVHEDSPLTTTISAEHEPEAPPPPPPPPIVPEPIDDLSRIERVETTMLMDHSSTLMISSTNDTCSTGRRLVLTASSLDDNQKTQFRSFINQFHASISSAVDSSTTHVIVNDSTPLICPLTGKIIQAIARHLFIVSHRWIDECLAQQTLVDERPFEVRGDTSLGLDHGGMRRSRLTPAPLLDKYDICLRCDQNDCAPLQTVEQVQELIELSGARLIQNFTAIGTWDKTREIVLVAGIQGLHGGEKKRKAVLNTCRVLNVRCVNIHWLLISIAKYEVQPIESYEVEQV